LEVKEMSKKREQEELYILAGKKIERRGFYIHLGLYLVFSVILAIVWRSAGKGFPWFAFPVGIWGIAILLHFLGVSVLQGRRPASDRLQKRIEFKVWEMKEAEKRKGKEGKK
jgi:uncharacterized membrane protein YagU involved in acid resistance